MAANLCRNYDLSVNIYEIPEVRNWKTGKGAATKLLYEIRNAKIV